MRRNARRAGRGVFDRRTMRGERTRTEIVEAAIELVVAGNPCPTIGQVADGAGVSRRLISYHFDQLDVLFGVAAATHLGRHRQLLVHLPPRGPVDPRIRATCHQRRQLFEAIAPVLRMADSDALGSPSVRAVLSELHTELRQQVAVTLGPEILLAADAPFLLQTVGAATGWDSWDDLRIRTGYSPAAAEKAMVYWVSHLLH